MAAVLRNAVPDPDERSPERLRVHYELERRLADRLRNASREERATLYGEVYEELFRSLPDHPQQRRARQTPAERAEATRRQVAIIEDFLRPGGRFVEVGAGDCAVSLTLASRAERVYAVEVSETISANSDMPDNFELLITDGREIPVPGGSIDVAYSNQLMEHLHPDDAVEQVTNIFRALAPGGVYICLTPHRLLGPADISAYFDDVPTGFHLREYSTRELQALFASAGFERVNVLALAAGRRLHLPAAPFGLIEPIAERLPRSVRHRRLVRKIIDPGGGVVAHKATS
jgi:SAM-dependent methyltransferase